MKNVIWFDVDGVLLDYTNSFLHFSEAVGGEVPLQYNYDTYDLSTLFRSKEVYRTLMHDFGCSSNFQWLAPLCTPHLLVALKQSGYELRYITKLPLPNIAKVNRIINLSATFGNIFSGGVFTGENDCKLDFLKRAHKYEPKVKYIVVEDNPEFLERAFDAVTPEFEVHRIEYGYNTMGYFRDSWKKTDDFVMEMLYRNVRRAEINRV